MLSMTFLFFSWFDSFLLVISCGKWIQRHENLTSASPDSGFAGNFQNGQRGYSASLDRSMTSFRDVIEEETYLVGRQILGGSATSSEDTSTLS